jgi:hypothetical protein
MPDFARAAISTSSQDLGPYTTFLRRLDVGQVVNLPLEDGESPRRVMRSVNAAAAQLNMRVARLQSNRDALRFRVLSPEKRTVHISDEAKRARVEKARATRQARRGRDRSEATGIDPDAAGDSTRARSRRRPARARAVEAEEASDAGSR